MSYPSCVHFNGIQKTCGAGIDPMSVRDVSAPGMATFPCLDTGKPCTKTCDHRRMMTALEQAEDLAALVAACDKAEADLAAGKCPACQEPIVERRQVGRCEYARPCGHRLGQIGGVE